MPAFTTAFAWHGQVVLGAPGRRRRGGSLPASPHPRASAPAAELVEALGVWHSAVCPGVGRSSRGGRAAWGGGMCGKYLFIVQMVRDEAVNLVSNTRKNSSETWETEEARGSPVCMGETGLRYGRTRPPLSSGEA